MNETTLQAVSEVTPSRGSGSKKSRSKDVSVTHTKDDRRPRGTHPNATIAQTVATMSLAGFTVRQVCEALKLSAETVAEHYNDEMQNGRTKMMTDVVGSLAQRAIAGSDAAAIFLAKARLGWSDRQSVELTGKDGGAIQIEHRAEILQNVSGILRQGLTIDGEAEPLD